MYFVGLALLTYLAIVLTDFAANRSGTRLFGGLVALSLALVAAYGTGVFSQLLHPVELKTGLSGESPIVAAVVYTAMLAGMAANELYETSWSKKHRKRVRMRDLTVLLFVSPLVFSFVWIWDKSQTLSISTLLFSFQNGFFWRAVLGRNVR